MLEVEERWEMEGTRVGRWVVWGAMMSRASPSWLKLFGDAMSDVGV